MSKEWEEKIVQELLDKLDFLKSYGFEVHEKSISSFGITIKYINDNYKIRFSTDYFNGTSLGEGYSFGISKKSTFFEDIKGIFYVKDLRL